MTDVVISPRREKGESRIADTGLLCVNPTETRNGIRLAKKQNAKRHRLFHSNLYQIPAPDQGYPYFIAGPAVGAPMAVLTLEKLVVLGAQRIIIAGWCGSLHRSLRIGDVLLPTWALSEEGTSRHYPVDRQVNSSTEIRKVLAAHFMDNRIRAVEGPLWTTDAPYRETRSKVTDYSRQSILGVDMEYSALCTVASYRNVEIAAALLVSDELWRSPWQPAYRNKEFKKKSAIMVQVLLDCCRFFADAKEKVKKTEE